MAITFYGGPPGSGKSYALVEQVIVEGVRAGRRVLTNITGVKPDEVYRYCAADAKDPSKLGRVVLFEGQESTKPGFWPTDEIPDADTFVKGGDLIVFDEWRLYWPRRGKMPTPDLEAFLRWHRHLVDARGVACDVAIASQIATDVSQDYRGLIERSYKFRKLKAVGLENSYAWEVWEGHLQPKGGSYQKGGPERYRPEIFALYKSYSAEGSAVELRTDKRASLLGGRTMWTAAACLAAFAFASWWVWDFFNGGATEGYVGDRMPSNNVARSPQLSQSALIAPPASAWRIVGHVHGDAGTRVIVAHDSGAIRVLEPAGFDFDGERPVSGTVDGQRVLAEDRVSIEVARPSLAEAFAKGAGL